MKYHFLLKRSFAIFLGLVAFSIIALYFLHQQQESLPMNQVAREKAPGEFAELSKGLTHYRLEGPEDGELVVLIHGGMVSGMFAWEKNFRFLTDNGFRVLMYDLYGRGFSHRPEGEYTPNLFFGQFKELTEYLGITRPMNIAALSLGSMVAIDYARNHPQHIKKLMLLSPAARGKFRVRPILKVPLISDILMTAYWYPRTVNSQMEEFYEPENFPEYEEKLREMIRYKGYKKSNYSTWVHTLTYNMEPAIKEIGNSHTPVALVLGEHDPYVPADEAKTYSRLIPDLEIFTIAEAGHIVNFEKPDEVNRLMLRFFSEVSTPGTGNADKKQL